MKKEKYMSPETVVVELDAQKPLLAGSPKTWNPNDEVIDDPNLIL